MLFSFHVFVLVLLFLYLLFCSVFFVCYVCVVIIYSVSFFCSITACWQYKNCKTKKEKLTLHSVESVLCYLMLRKL